MRLRHFRLGALIALGGLSLTACFPAAQRPHVKQGDYEELHRQIAALAQAQMRKHAIEGMSLALVDGPQVIMTAGFGSADKEKKLKASEDTLYQVGSITKLFTATAIMQLSEQGKLQLDAPLTTYLPEFDIRSRFPDSSPITLRQLLTHHAGLPANYLKGFFNPHPPRFTSLLNDLKDEHLASEPGTLYSYSNVGFSLLGCVVERVSGERYEEYVERHVLAPIGMRSSGFAPSHPDRLTKTYRKGKFEVEPDLRDRPAGGLLSSARDMTRFMQAALAQGQLGETTLLQPASMAEMLRPQNVGVPLDFGFRIGLGWILTHPSLGSVGPVAWHNGSTVHQHAAMITLPEQGLGVTVLTNSTGGQIASMAVAEESLKLLLQAKTGALPSPAEPDAPRELSSLDALKPFAGSYATPMGTAELKGGRLMLPGQAFDVLPGPLGTYKLKFKLFGLIPLDLPALKVLSLRFETVGARDVVVLSQNGFTAALGERMTMVPMTGAWRQRLGRYEVENLEGDYELAKHVALVEENGQLALSSQDALGLRPPVKLHLQPLSDHEAVVSGLGSGLGEVLRIEASPSGERLLYSGYRLVRR